MGLGCKESQRHGYGGSPGERTEISWEGYCFVMMLNGWPSGTVLLSARACVCASRADLLAKGSRRHLLSVFKQHFSLICQCASRPPPIRSAKGLKRACTSSSRRHTVSTYPMLCPSAFLHRPDRKSARLDRPGVEAS